MVIQRIFVLSAWVLVTALHVSAQTEMGDIRGPSKSWTMLSFHRVWVPQNNNKHNDGFGASFFATTDPERILWFGGTITTTGVAKRELLAIEAGVGVWIVGSARLGMFGYLTSGLGMSAQSGLTGFNFFTDPTLTFGLATQGGVGGAFEIASNIRLHVTAVGMWYTNEQGATPYGLQVGLTFGGK